jgi:DNA-binding NarL/FixJ family response regulator
LTRREGDVLRLVAEGAGNREIAQVLQLGDKTVRNYVSRLYRKLAINDRADITSLALRSEMLADAGISRHGLRAHQYIGDDVHDLDPRP